jgi:prefoldin subunit 5
MVNVRRPGAANDNGSDGLVAEIRALREEVAELRRTAGSIDRTTSKMESTLTNVTEGGRVMLTEAAS